MFINTIWIPTSIKSIDTEAFNCCHSFTVNYEGLESEWSEIQIGDNNIYLLNSKINYNALKPEMLAIKVDDIVTVVGSEINVPISIENNQGISSLAFKVNYDEQIMKLTKVTYNAEMVGTSAEPDLDENPFRLAWNNGTSNTVYDGVFAILTFTVVDNIVDYATTSIEITYDQEDIFKTIDIDGNTENVPTLIKNGKVVVNTTIPGDINGDNCVNNKDLVRFAQYLACWDVVVNEKVLDVNGDNKINNKDLVRLAQYLAGWNVQIH